MSSSAFAHFVYTLPPRVSLTRLPLIQLPPMSNEALQRRVKLQTSASKSVLVFSVSSDDEWGPDPPPNGLVTDTTAVRHGSSLEELKRALLHSLTDKGRGLKASCEDRAEIMELISQLEARNPTPAPTQALPLLNGKWILVYTSFSELFPLLASGTVPLLEVGEISQSIDSSDLTVQNSVLLKSPVASTSFSAKASFIISSPRRVKIKFEEGIIGTPQLTDSLIIPEDAQVIGQKIDLKPLQGLFKSIQDTASSIARNISGRPPIKFPIRSENSEKWLLTTFLDEDLRISRGDGGSIFVLVKEGSALLEEL